MGLKSDGTVVIAQSQYHQKEAEALAQWTDIVSIRAYNDAVLGLRSDGTVCFICPEGHYYPKRGDVEIHEELASWTDISAIELTEEFAAGLKTDGTVVVTAGIRENFDVDAFRGHKIVEIDAKYYDMIGLTEDGRIIRTAVATENIEEMDSWKGIRKP